MISNLMQCAPQRLTILPRSTCGDVTREVVRVQPELDEVPTIEELGGTSPEMF